MTRIHAEIDPRDRVLVECALSQHFETGMSGALDPELDWLRLQSYAIESTDPDGVRTALVEVWEIPHADVENGPSPDDIVDGPIFAGTIRLDPVAPRVQEDRTEVER